MLTPEFARRSIYFVSSGGAISTEISIDEDISFTALEIALKYSAPLSGGIIVPPLSAKEYSVLSVIAMLTASAISLIGRKPSSSLL